MKKQWIAGMLLLQCMVMAGCGNAQVEKELPSSPAPEVSVAPAEMVTDEDQEPEASAAVDSKELQTVGNETVGYVSVPSTWVKFEDVDGSTAFQYSNAEGTDIISMNLFDDSGISESEKAEMNVENAAKSVWYNLESNGVTDIKGAKVALNTLDAYQVYGAYTDEDHGLASCIVCWIFEDEKGNFHYVSAEAPMTSITDVVSYVEDSFTLSDAE